MSFQKPPPNRASTHFVFQRASADDRKKAEYLAEISNAGLSFIQRADQKTNIFPVDPNSPGAPSRQEKPIQLLHDQERDTILERCLDFYPDGWLPDHFLNVIGEPDDLTLMTARVILNELKQHASPLQIEDMLAINFLAKAPEEEIKKLRTLDPITEERIASYRSMTHISDRAEQITTIQHLNWIEKAVFQCSMIALLEGAIKTGNAPPPTQVMFADDLIEICKTRDMDPDLTILTVSRFNELSMTANSTSGARLAMNADGTVRYSNPPGRRSAPRPG